jgi:hypothetical protein
MSFMLYMRKPLAPHYHGMPQQRVVLFATHNVVYPVQPERLTEHTVPR